MGMNSLNDIWDKVIEILSNQLTPTAINTWFSDCTPVDIEDCRLVLHTTTEFKRNIINSRFSESIKAVLSDIFACDFDLLVLAGDEVNDFELKKKSENSLPEMDGYTFDNFIVGSSNKFAHAAAIAVAENPGKAYNPLFIYGNSGLGKTHLLLAIGQEIHSRSPEKSIAYIKGDEFTNQMVKSLRENKAEEFRTKYRNVSLFLVDDIQFIAGKQGTQEEFFHTFNNIYEAGNQIVITSDRPPMEMAQLDDRLRTRFEWGLMADIQPPDLETKIAILKRKALERKCPMPDDVLEFLANDSGHDVRTLEGRLTKVLFASKLHEEPISLGLAKLALSESVSESGTSSEEITPDVIISSVCGYYKYKREDILGKGKKADLVKARQICAYLMCEMLSLPLISIGNVMGGRDHTTIMYSRDKIEELIRLNEKIAKEVDDIKNIVLKQ